MPSAYEEPIVLVIPHESSGTDVIIGMIPLGDVADRIEMLYPHLNKQFPDLYFTGGSTSVTGLVSRFIPGLLRYFPPQLELILAKDESVYRAARTLEKALLAHAFTVEMDFLSPFRSRPTAKYASGRR